MNRVYLCVLGLVLLYCDIDIYEFINISSILYSIFTDNICGISSCYDNFEILIIFYFMYVLYSHILETSFKFFNLILKNLKLNSIVYTNICIDILYVLYIGKGTLRRIIYKGFIYIFWVFVIFYILMYLYGLFIYNFDISVLKFFYVGSITHGITYYSRTYISFMNRMMEFSYFDEVVGFNYYSIFDITRTDLLSGMHILLGFIFDTFYCIFIILLYIYIRGVSNINLFNISYKTYILNSLLNIVYIYICYNIYSIKKIFMKYVYTFLFFYSYGIIVFNAYTFIDMLNYMFVYEFNILYSSIFSVYIRNIVCIYDMATLCYKDLFGTSINNSLHFWPYCCYKFSRGYEELEYTQFCELLPTTSVYTYIDMYECNNYVHSLFYIVSNSISVYVWDFYYGFIKSVINSIKWPFVLSNNILYQSGNALLWCDNLFKDLIKYHKDYGVSFVVDMLFGDYSSKNEFSNKYALCRGLFNMYSEDGDTGYILCIC